MSMEDTAEVKMCMESPLAIIEQLGQSFNKLKSHTEAALQLQDRMQWDNIKEHFLNLERVYKSNFKELEQKQKTFEQKQSEARALIAEKEADVSAQERASLNRLQKLKDEAVSAIAEAREKYKVEIPEILNAKASRDKKVRTSVNDPDAPCASEDNTPANGLGGPSKAMAVEIKPRPLFKQLCEKMDSKSLLKFLSENWKKLSSLRDELSVALRYATDPARFVLDCLGGFYPPKSNSQWNSSARQGMRRSCIILMEAVDIALGLKELGVNHPISSEIKEKAKAIAEDWKPHLAEVDLDASDGNSLEAQAFLQLLSTFNVHSVLDEDELCKIVVDVSRHKQTPELCRSLGLTERIPGIIEELVKRSRHIDAVRFIQAFGLSEHVPPAPLLNAYLEEFKASHHNNEEVNSAAVQKDRNTKELFALREVIKCIEENKLQKDYALGPLQKRVAQLKPIVEKRPSAVPSNFRSKKPRTSGGYAAQRPVVAVNNRQPLPVPYADRYTAAGVVDRYHYTAPPTTYVATAYATYGNQYNGPRPYQYPSEAVASSASYTAASYYDPYGGAQAAATNYTGYASNGAQPPSSSYGNYTGSVYQASHQP